MITANKKILNATPTSYNGINFRSKLEVVCYKVLKEQGFKPEYEQHKFVLFDGFVPCVSFYTRNTFKGKNRNLQVLSHFTAKDQRFIGDWVYTPDITFEYKGYRIIIEVKGQQNDNYPYKKKLFRYKLEQIQAADPGHIYEFWEIHTKTQLLECLNHIK